MPRFFTILFLALLAARTTRAADVLTWHNDAAHHGVNAAETILTPQTVNDRLFGQLFSFPTDGYAYAQPLVVADLDFPGGGATGGKHTAVFVATEHDSVYAFDTAANNGESSILWHASFIDPAKRITPVPTEDVRSQDLVPEIGITSTPAIDRDTNTIYVVARTKEIRTVTPPPSTQPSTQPAAQPYDQVHWVQKLHALDLTTGSEKPGSPFLLGDSYSDRANQWHDDSPIRVAGHGAGQINGIVHFNALREHQRPGLILDRGHLFIAYASHGDQQPVHGWILAFDAQSLRLLATLCTSPNGSLSTTWMAGASPAIDAEGNLYLATGNGEVTAPTGGRDYGESVLRVSTKQVDQGTLTIADYFTPSNFDALNNNDLDLGSGGPMLMPFSDHPRIIVGGKEGIVFLLDGDHLGHVSPGPIAAPGHAIQIIKSLGHLDAPTHHEINIINTPATFGHWLYYTSRTDPVTQFLIQPDGTLKLDPVHRASEHFNFAPPTPSISSNGDRDGIVWVINNGVPATLLAYDASDVSKLLYDSNASGSRDRLDGGVKFSLPTIANGKVFVGTQDNLTVFGLLPSAKVHPANPTDLTASVVDAHHIDLTWQRHSDDELAFRIERAANDEGFRQIDTTAHGTTSYSDHGDSVHPDTIYRYRITATNLAGESHSIESERVTTPAAPPDPALIAHWPMDEGTGSRVADSASISPDYGIIHGEVVWAHGHVGVGALGFHGAGVAPGYVEIPDAPKLRFTRNQSFTLSAWVQPAAAPNKWAGVVTRATPDPAGVGLWCDDQNHWCFGTPTDPHTLAAGNVTLGWHQIVGVQDAQSNRRGLYLDGHKLTDSTGAFPADAVGDLWIGGSKGDESKYIDARIDDVRLYNRALTSDEIATLFVHHNPPAPTQLTAEVETGKSTHLHWLLAPAESQSLPATIRVERSIAGAPFSQIARLNSKSDHFDDVSAGSFSAMAYRVMAENSSGDSDPATATAINRSVTVLFSSIKENHPATPARLQAGFKKGDRLLVDRDFTALTTIAHPNAADAPAIDLAGAEVIRTANDDKHQADYRLTYTLAQPSTIYLMVDQRNLPRPGLPGGTEKFADTHTHLTMGQVGTYELFVATQAPGEYALGPQVTGSSFYWLAALPSH